MDGVKFTERVFTNMIEQAKAEQAAEIEAEIRFHSRPEIASAPVYAFGKSELMNLKKKKDDG